MDGKYLTTLWPLEAFKSEEDNCLSPIPGRPGEPRPSGRLPPAAAAPAAAAPVSTPMLMEELLVILLRAAAAEAEAEADGFPRAGGKFPRATRVTSES